MIGVHHAAARVHLDLLISDFAVQRALVKAFDAELADVLRRAVSDHRSRVHRLEIVLADSSHRADRVRRQRGVRIVTYELRVHLRTDQAKPIHSQRGVLLFRQRDLEWNRLERPAPVLVALTEVVDLVVRKRDELADFSQQLVQVAHAFLHDRQREHRPVVREQHAMAIEDQPARRRERLELNPVLVRSRRVLVVIEHLELHEPRDEYERAAEREQEQYDHARREARALARRVLEMCCFGHALSRKNRPYRQHRNCRSLAVVRVPGDQGPRPVDLLGHQHPHQPMRQRERGQRPARLRPLETPRV